MGMGGPWKFRDQAGCDPESMITERCPVTVHLWGKLELMRWGANQEMIWVTNRSSWPPTHFDFFSGISLTIFYCRQFLSLERTKRRLPEPRQELPEVTNVRLVDTIIQILMGMVRGCCWYLSVWGWVGSGGLCWRGWEKYCWCLRMGVGGGGPPFSQLVSRRQLPKRFRCIFEMFFCLFSSEEIQF